MKAWRVVGRIGMEGKLFGFFVFGLGLSNLLVFLAGLAAGEPTTRLPQFYFFWVPSIVILAITLILWRHVISGRKYVTIGVLLLLSAFHAFLTHWYFIPVSTIVTGLSMSVGVLTSLLRYFEEFPSVSNAVDEISNLKKVDSEERRLAIEMLHSEVVLFFRIILTAGVYSWAIASAAFSILWVTGRTPFNIYLLAAVVIFLTYLLIGGLKWLVWPLVRHLEKIRGLLLLNHSSIGQPSLIR